ncbi:MAG: sodium-independent anion transporter, partial [Roseivirga sp.]|nr:sodium-independent anion transporter [Roseivirga sp.]
VLGRVKGIEEYRNVKRFNELETWPELLVLRVDAPFAFVNIQTIKDKVVNEVQKRNGELKYVVLDAASVAYIDATGVIGLRELIESLEEKNITMLFAEVIGPVRDAFYKNELIKKGEKHAFFLTTNDAVNYCLSGKFEDGRAHLVSQTNA